MSVDLDLADHSPAPTTWKTYDRRMQSEGSTRSAWTFFTNHAHVLIAVSREPELRQRDISDLVGITEGAVQRILHELEDAGYLHRERVGRRNRYQVAADRPLRHSLEGGHTVADILDSVNADPGR